MMSDDGGSSPASEKFTARGGQSQLRACPMARRSRVAEATLGSRKRSIHARGEKPALAPHLLSPAFLESSSQCCLAAQAPFSALSGSGPHQRWLCHGEAVTL